MADNSLPPPPPTLGQVRELFTAECASPAWVIVGAVGFETMLAFISFFSPSWKDTVKEGPGRTSWIHQMKVVLSEGEEIKPVWFVWFEEKAYAIFEFLDKAAFWLMIASLTAEGLIKSTSMIWPWSPCFPKHNSFYIYSKTAVGALEGNGPEWQAGLGFTRCFSNVNVEDTGVFVTFPPFSVGELAIAAAWQGEDLHNNISVDMRIRDADDNKIIAQNNFNFERFDPHKTQGIFLKNINTGSKSKTYFYEFKQNPVVNLLTTPVLGHLMIKWDVYDGPIG